MTYGSSGGGESVNWRAIDIFEVEVGTVFECGEFGFGTFLLLDKTIHTPEEGFFIGASVKWLDLKSNETNSAVITNEGPIFWVPA